jgi:hypothetical protein
MSKMTSFLRTATTTLLVGMALTACNQVPLQTRSPLAMQLPAQPMRVSQPVNNAVTLLLKFKPNTTRNERSLLLSQYNLVLKEVLNSLDLYLVVVPAQAPLSLLQNLKTDTRLSYAEANTNQASQANFLTAQPALNPSRLAALMGKEVELEGIYSSQQPGASLTLSEGDQLPLVSQQGAILSSLPRLEDRSRVRLIGIVRPINSGTTSPVALMPVKYQRI